MIAFLPYMPPLTPSGRQYVHSGGLKHHWQTLRQQLCITHVHWKACLLASFPPHPSFHSSSPNPSSPFSFSPYHSIRNRWSHQRASFIPFTYCTHHAVFSSSSLNPHWSSIVSDNQRHLSQEPAAQTREDASKRGPNSGKTVETSQGTAAEDDFKWTRF